MFLTLREFDFFGMFVEPAVIALVVSVLLFSVIRAIVSRLVDLDRFLWHQPLVDIASLVILYAIVILTLKAV